MLQWALEAQNEDFASMWGLDDMSETWVPM
jgi:hypothetical protein